MSVRCRQRCPACGRLHKDSHEKRVGTKSAYHKDCVKYVKKKGIKPVTSLYGQIKEKLEKHSNHTRKMKQERKTKLDGKKPKKNKPKTRGKGSKVSGRKNPTK